MYTILCQNKHLMITKKTAPIYQNDNRVDTLRFLIEPMYDDNDLSHYTVMAQITLPSEGKGKLEVLSFEEELYKEHMISNYVITNAITQYVGNITISLYLHYYSEEEDKTYVINTNTINIEVLANNYTGENIDIEENIDILTQMQNQITQLQTNKLDTKIAYNDKDGEIQFYANDEKVGEPIKVDNEIGWETE